MAGGLEGVDLVCLDDLQGVTGESHWEEALFHLFNRLRARKGSILACADRQGATSLRGSAHLARLRTRDGARQVVMGPLEAEQIELFP